MGKQTKGPSFFSGALALLSGKPARTAKGEARKSSAKILAKQGRPTQTKAASSHRSAEIVCGKGACSGANALAGTRFLLSDLPRIPLPNCTSPQCRCTYSHYNDRRNPLDERRAPFSMRTNLYSTSVGNEERRRKVGRRAGEVAGGKERYEFGNWDS